MNREKSGKAATLGDLIKEKLGDKLHSVTARAQQSESDKATESE
jgi:hypothetical protein